MRKILLTASTLVAAASAFAAFGASPSQAAAEWCSFTQSAMATNCAYTTLAQCKAAVTGQGGTCERNVVGIRNAQARFVAPGWHAATISTFKDDESARLAR